MAPTGAGAGSIHLDTYAALVELASPISRGAHDGVARLATLRAALRAAGGTLLGAGIHPAGAFGDVVHVPQERYLEIARQLRGLLRRTPTCALHVHVGMPDAASAVRALNGLREHLPLLQALAAASPFWHGTDSGLASARAQLFRGYPRADIPDAADSWEQYAERVQTWWPPRTRRTTPSCGGTCGSTRARDGRGARHGRPGAAVVGRRPGRPRPRPRPRGGRGPRHRPAADARGGPHGGLLPRRPGRPGHHAVGSGDADPAATADLAREQVARLRPLAGTWAAQGRRSSSSSACSPRAAARPASGRRSRAAGCPACLALLVDETAEPL
jgi:hypothetical protein